MDHWRNQKGNKKISRGKWKWKHDTPKLWDVVNYLFYIHQSLMQSKQHNKNKCLIIGSKDSFLFHDSHFVGILLHEIPAAVLLGNCINHK